MDANKVIGYDGAFATRLRELMKSTKATQQDVAAAAGTTRQAISQYADGSVQPNIEKLYKIADYFKVSADYLLGMSDITSSDIDDKAINQMLGLSQQTIDRLKSDMDLLYKVTKTTTPDEAISILKRLNSFVQEGHKLKEIVAFALSLGMDHDVSNNEDYCGPLLLINKFLLCEIVNELVYDDECAEDVFTIARSLNEIFSYHTQSEHFQVKELYEKEEYLMPTGASFLINQNDVFNIRLLRLQESLIKRKNRLSKVSDGD